MNTEVINEITCVRHGDKKSEAFVCEHLITGNRLGFYFDTEEKGNPFPDAWCASCESIRQKYGGTWNEESEYLIKVKLVCSECYVEMKAKNILGTEAKSDG